MRGIGASSGIGIGKVYIKKDRMEIPQRTVENIVGEKERLMKAVEACKIQLKEITEKTTKTMGKEESKIFEAHIMMLEDPEFLQQVKEKIEGERKNVEWAVQEVTDALVQMFESIEDEYFQQRSSDIKDVATRVLKNLLGVKDLGFQHLNETVVIVAHDLTPSDTAEIPRDKIAGFITEIGGYASHVAIMARTLEIPAIVGTRDILQRVVAGDIIVFDGDNGEYIINPVETVIEAFNNRKELLEKEKQHRRDLVGKSSVSKDGFPVEITCNIGSVEDLKNVKSNDGEGIGLFRTEFLYMNRKNPPSEDEQFYAYREVAEKMKNKPVIIRTLDIGGDKQIPYMKFPKEENPFLGFRAIRYCLQERDIFKTQLRGILRASVFGDVKIMIPMISSLEEIRKTKEILQEAKEELEEKSIAYNPKIEVGVMIEIPAAAIISDILAKEVDFFSIGTNDLIQYTIAVDRMNENLSQMYTPYHSAVLRLIKMTIDNGNKAGIWIGMCGEAAGDERLVPLLLGMGLKEFSVPPSAVLKLRRLIRDLSKKEMEKHVSEVMQLEKTEDIMQYIDKYIYKSLS